MFSFQRKSFERIKHLLKISSGCVFADVGAGRGGASIYFSKVVGPEGAVFSVEFNPKRIKLLEKKARSFGLKNMRVIKSEDKSVNLPPNFCDAILLKKVYHHFVYPKEMGEGLYSSLRTGGRLMVIDFTAPRWLSLVSPVKGVPKNRAGHGIPKDIVIAELKELGLKLVEEIPNWAFKHKQYCLVFEK